MKKTGILLFLLFLGGCFATVGGLKKARGNGAKRTYNDSYQKVYAAARAVLNATGLKIVESSDDLILAKTAFDYTVLVSPVLSKATVKVAIFFYKIDEQKTELEIIAKSEAPLNPRGVGAAREFPNKFFLGLEQELAK